MRILLIAVFFLSVFAAPTYAQEGRVLAKSYEQYVMMYKNPKYKMVRNHRQFIAYAKNNRVLSTYLKGEHLKSFLISLQFSEDGLITFSYDSAASAYPKMRKAIFSEIAKGIGWDPVPLGVDYEGYKCNGRATCVSCGNCVCLGDSCGKSVLTGPDYNPEVLMN